MELKRRDFITLTLTAGAAMATGAWHLLRKASPTRIVRALRANRYPGHVQPLDKASVSQPGPWAG